jgi:xanthosine utilization system XapX-like protein
MLKLRIVGLLALLLGYIIGMAATGIADAQPRTVACYSKGGLEVAGVCIDRRVIIR